MAYWFVTKSQRIVRLIGVVFVIHCISEVCVVLMEVFGDAGVQYGGLFGITHMSFILTVAKVIAYPKEWRNDSPPQPPPDQSSDTSHGFDYFLLAYGIYEFILVVVYLTHDPSSCLMTAVVVMSTYTLLEGYWGDDEDTTKNKQQTNAKEIKIARMRVG